MSASSGSGPAVISALVSPVSRASGSSATSWLERSSQPSPHRGSTQPSPQGFALQLELPRLRLVGHVLARTSFEECEEVVEEHEVAGGVSTADHVSGQTEERLGLDAGEGLPPALGRKGHLGMGTGPEGNRLLDALG